jgi:uncharacterized protein YdhG (YjbR/CyaY superfamily)
MAADTFTKEEKAAMREATKERKAKLTEAEAAAQVLEKIKAMAPADRKLAEQVHKLVQQHRPDLKAKTWYGMQAYFKDGKVVAFFQDGGKFQSRYCTLGFQQDADLDDGQMWPTSFAVLEINPGVEKQIVALLKRV